jgi:Rrf2 family transcriptional regulator, nitric oxide-sensitive transcriptional repressor
MNNMLAITEATSIAIHLCAKLTTTGTELYSSRKIAEEFDFSMNHLAKVVQRLVKGGVLESSRGKYGGIRLKKPADKISVTELNELVAELHDRACLLDRRICPGGKCSFGKWLQLENQKIADSLRKTTIKEIAESLTLKPPR